MLPEPSSTPTDFELDTEELTQALASASPEAFARFFSELNKDVKPLEGFAVRGPKGRKLSLYR